MLDRPVEVLLLDPAQPATEEVLDAARRASLVEDERLRRIYEVATSEGRAFVVGEPARGTTLADYASHGPVPPEQARAIVGEAAAALDSARRHGVRHLALDARSVRVTDDGEVMVTGTGVANALGENLVLTPARASRKDAGDLVGLLYLALTGRPVGTDDGSAPPPPATLVDRVPPDLDDLCVRTFDEGAGPSSAGDLFHTLAPWGDIDPPPRSVRRSSATSSAGAGAAPPPPPPAGGTTPERSSRASAAGAGAGAAGMGAAGAAGAAATGAAGGTSGSASGPGATPAPPPPPPADASTEEISAVDDDRPEAPASAPAEQRPSSTLGGRLRRRPGPPSIPPSDGSAGSAPAGAAAGSGSTAGSAASAGAAGLGAAAAGTLAAGAAAAQNRSGTTDSHDRAQGGRSGGPTEGSASGAGAPRDPHSAPAGPQDPSNRSQDPTSRPTDGTSRGRRGPTPYGTPPGGTSGTAAGATGAPDGSAPHGRPGQDGAPDPLEGIVPTTTAARFDALTRRVVGGARPPVRHARVATAHLPLPDPDAPGSAPEQGDGRRAGRDRRAGAAGAAGAGAGAAGAGAGPASAHGAAGAPPPPPGEHPGATTGTVQRAGATHGDEHAPGTGRGSGHPAAAGTAAGPGAAGAGPSIGAKASAAAAAAAAGIGGASASFGRSVGRARSSIQERLSNPGRLEDDEAGEQPLDVPYGTSGSDELPAVDERTREVPVSAAGRSGRSARGGAAAYRPDDGADARDDGSLMDDRVAGREVGRGTIDPMPWVVVLFLVVVVLGAWWATRTLMTPTSAVELPSETPPVVTPDPVEESPSEAPTAGADSDLPAPVLSRTELVDPEGGGTDNADTAPLAADGDIDTYWRSLSYQSPTYGVKSGTGLLVWLEDISAVSGLTIDTFADGEGGHVEIRVSDPATPGEGALLAEGPLEAGETTFTWDTPAQTAHLIVWITELPTAGTDGANRAEIAEITVQ
ncbi:hypothetical protein ACPYO6_06085 [Georgenia sp. Z1344]|uniref:hypothetical protein n=1 Tax=Georgenia sp. Z1344 TaxID=3416706 RepID=UPI003CF9A28D